MRPRRFAARVANLGLLVFGLALVVVVGTGGTRLDLGIASVSLRRAAPPLTFFCCFAALRLLCANRATGLEARLVRFFGRLGAPPRDAPSSVGAAVRAGALLGGGLGIVATVADIARFVAGVGRPAPDGTAWVAVVTTVLGLIVGCATGALIGLLVVAAATMAGRPLGRYETGRFTLTGLVAVLPGLVWLAPPTGAPERAPAALLAAAAATPPALVVTFLLAPAALVRARRGQWGLAAASGVGLVALLGSAALLVRGPTGLYAPAREGGHPNVLLISLSGLRGEFLTASGGEGRFTPALTELARRAAVFREASSPSVGLAPAAVSLLTGLYPAAHGVRDPGQRLRAGLDGLPSVLAAHGLRTAAFVSHRELAGRATGLEGLFGEYSDPTTLADWLDQTALGRPFARRFAARRAVTRPARSTVEAFREWAASMPRGPWFAWVEIADPLRPRPTAPPAGEGAPSVTRLTRPERPLPLPPAWASAAEREQPSADWMYGYALALRDADDAVAALTRIVAARGELQQTLFVVVSEQGAALGEAGSWFERPPGLADGVLRTPWIVAGPGVQRGAKVAGPCSLVDVTPTILGLISLAGPRAMDGEDLSRHIEPGSTTLRDPYSGPVFAEAVREPGASGFRARAVRLGRWKLVRRSGGVEQFFVSENGAERELLQPRGWDERQRVQLSDLLTRRQAQEDDQAGD